MCHTSASVISLEFEGIKVFIAATLERLRMLVAMIMPIRLRSS
jgi:hypothetical protein